MSVYEVTGFEESNQKDAILGITSSLTRKGYEPTILIDNNTYEAIRTFRSITNDDLEKIHTEFPQYKIEEVKEELPV